jgi:L-threonylcarbamoyladenylate synthase
MIAQDDIDQAVQALRAGQVIGLPTETVYGLAADAANPAALRQIFAAKGRPVDHPLIVHIGHIQQLATWAREVPAAAQRLAEAFWPGPLTMILKKQPSVSDLVTGQQDTVGLRMPNHPVALAVLRAFGGGVAAPSANRFGRISPTTAAAVREELGEAVALVLEGGQCDVGVESTIVDVSGEQPVVLRPGMISVAELEAVLGTPVWMRQQDSPRVSGSLESHYAPVTRTVLVERERLVGFLQNLSSADLPVVVLGYSSLSVAVPGVTWVKMSAEPRQYAHDLYWQLREMDKRQFSQIVIEAVPSGVAWDAVRDRLGRASFSV